MRDFICGRETLIHCTGEILGLALFLAVVVWLAIWWAWDVLKRGRCRHDGTVGETMGCEAICHKCGANLGFIGAWRAKRERAGSYE